MILLYEELFTEKEIEINIDDLLLLFENKYAGMYDEQLKSNKNSPVDKLYEEYDSLLLKKNFVTSIEELLLLKGGSSEEELKDTYFLRSIKIESIRRVLRDKERKDKFISDKIDKYNTKFRYYPQINEYEDYEKFLQDLSLKKEFAIHYIPKKRPGCPSHQSNTSLASGLKTVERLTPIFELSPHQLFLKNYLSPQTPYNGILIFHGVGVGKTCSGVSIAENFKGLYKKTIILAPEKIQNGWKKTIFDPSEKTEDRQCTQNEYINEEDVYEKNKDKMASARIKENYEMYGYLAFANSVKKYLEENTREISSKDLITKKQKEISLIKEKYSDRVLIIDEVHKIRSSAEGQQASVAKARDTIIYIEKVIKYSDNLKLILLTANPMFNQPEEIIWILNMLLLNDNRNIIKDNITFGEKGVLDEQSANLIKEYSKGYISYLRGENPVTFPYRIDISEISNETRRIMKPKDKTIFGTENKNKTIKFMELYSSPLRGDQFKRYVKEIKGIRNQDNIQDVTYYGKMLQISNCIYPNKSEDIEDCYGESGVRNCFTIKSKKPVKYSLKPGVPNFLDLDNLGNYACKIKTIIEKINNSDGIVFIYSNFLDGGILPLVLALEQNGYIKYGNEEILTSDKKRKPLAYDGTEYELGGFRATYSVIAGGSLKMTDNFEKELDILNSFENKEGKLIKIVIGSTVAAEGLDFKNIRSIHLLEPWHNINKLEQVIGRGIRNCSHAMLEDLTMRNVTIYLHSCELKNNESIETYLYRTSFNKSTQIGQIETILKEVAIDKYLFQYSNLIKESDVESILVKPGFRGNNRFSTKPFDKPYSRTCSFLKECDYMKHKYSIIDKIKNKELEESTFTIEYSRPIIDTYKKYIAIIIVDYFSLNYNKIVEKMKQNYDNFIPDIFNHALNEMLIDKYTIEKNKHKGYIKYTDNNYIFQPINNHDIFLPSYYRINSGPIDVSDYRLELDNYSLIDIPEVQVYGWDEIYKLYDKIINYEFSNPKTPGVDYKSIVDLEYSRPVMGEATVKVFSDSIKYSFYIERLDFKDKCKLLYSILELKLEKTKIKEKYNDFVKDLTEIIGPLFIYNNDKTADYEWQPRYDSKNLNKLYGGFLFYQQRNDFVMFQYTSKQLILCNNVVKENILNDYVKIPKSEIISKNMFGTLIYNLNIGSDNFNKQIVLKHKREEDKAKGKIVLQSGWRELSSQNLLKYIEKKYGTIYKETNIKSLLSVKGTNSKYLTVFALELLLRKSENFIRGDLLWLYYY